MPELKPCPFCGETNLHSVHRFNPGDDPTWEIVCTSCGVVMAGKDQGEAERLWNARATLSVESWWNCVCHSSIFSSAWQDMSWDQLPDHVREEIRKVYEPCHLPATNGDEFTAQLTEFCAKHGAKVDLDYLSANDQFADYRVTYDWKGNEPCHPTSANGEKGEAKLHLSHHLQSVGASCGNIVVAEALADYAVNLTQDGKDRLVATLKECY